MSSFCNSWKIRNPGIEYLFYDDAACRRLVECDFPQYLACYDGLPYPVQRADFFRYLVVYRFGGLYADIDMECLQPFDCFFSLSGAVLSIEMQISRQRQKELGYKFPYQLANCIFAAEASNPFFLAIIERTVSLAGDNPDCPVSQIEDVTGPRMLTRAFFDLQPPEVTVLNQIFWMPPREYPKLYPFRKNMFACHHFFGSWKSPMKRTRKRDWIERGIFPTPFPKTASHTLSSVHVD